VRCYGFCSQPSLAGISRTRREKTTMPENDPAQDRSAKTVFAFYGRVGRDEPVGSADWQRLAAENWLRGRRWSSISVYIDTVPRTTPWAERPQARALLKACARPTRAVTAVVAGDAAQAFGPDQLGPAITLLGRHGARLWAPEFGGAADPGTGQHRLIIDTLSGIAPSLVRQPHDTEPHVGRADRPRLPASRPRRRRKAR
jgi:hypothetical protein